MRFFSLHAVAAALVLLGGVPGALAQVRYNEEQFVDQHLLLKLLQLQKLLPALSSKNCDAEAAAPCIIEMKLISAGGRNYCLAVAPHLSVKRRSSGGVFNKKIVRWQLSVPSLDSKPLVFHADSGIVIVSDADAQVDKKGDYGDGSGSSSPDTYHTKTKRNKRDAQTAYLPVILWGSGGDEELCAAIDPKIVNVE